MSASNPQTFVEFLQSLPIPWLVAGANGAKEQLSNGTVLDQQADLIKQAVKARMPDYAPADALPHIGGDRALVQGPSETNANFITRTKTPWDDWARAGTHLEMLVQLYWIGFSGAIVVQQNGLAYSLSGAPTAGADPTGLLTITNLGTVGATPGLAPNPLYDNNPASKTFNTNGYKKTIPTASQWWTFDEKTDFCSRFAILFPATGGLIAGDGSIGAADLSRLQSIIKTWRRGTQTCVGVYVATVGKMLGWPVRTLATMLLASTVVTVNGTWQ